MTLSRDIVVPVIPINGAPTANTVLAALKTASPRDSVLSVYLDTSPTRVMAGAHLLALRDKVKLLRAERGNASHEIGKDFETAVARIERFLSQQDRFTDPAWAYFSSRDPDFFYATPLPQTIGDQVGWSATPILGPLEQILNEQKRTVVLLFDSEQSRLYKIFLGGIQHVFSFSDYVPSKHRGGGWLALDESHQTRHRESKLIQHANHTIRETVRVLRCHPFDNLIVAGPDEPVALLIRHLPDVLSSRLIETAKIELFASEDEIRLLALNAMRRVEQANQLAKVQQLFDAEAPDRAVVGTTNVLAGLSDARIDQLLIATEFATGGYKCLECGRLSRESRCPACGAETIRVENLREEILKSADACGAPVTFVGDEAGQHLMLRGGIGAWTHYG